MPAIEIAAALHYTTPSAFSRAFSHWAGGTNPRRVRTAAAVARAGTRSHSDVQPVIARPGRAR